MKKLLFGLPVTVGLGLFTALSFAIPKAEAGLLVGNTEGNNVLIFDERTGKFGGEFIPAGTGGLLSPDDLTFGPDGNLYITSGDNTSGSILRFDGKSGDFLGRFDNGGTLFRPYGLAFGPDNKAYVSSFRTDQILRYDALTGDFLDVFAAGNGSADGLNGPNDLLFGPDGSLYVSTQGSVADGTGGISFLFESQVLKYDLATGNPSVFVPKATPLPDSFNFVSFLGLGLGLNGELVTSDFANGIRSYDFSTGALLNTIATNYTETNPSNNFIGNFTFDPNGNLFTVGFDTSQANQGAILRFDGPTGAPLPAPGLSSAVFVPTSPLLQRPIGITYAPIAVPEPGLLSALLVLGVSGVMSQLKRSQV